MDRRTFFARVFGLALAPVIAKHVEPRHPFYYVHPADAIAPTTTVTWSNMDGVAYYKVIWDGDAR
jgi:hypothetical protein